MNPPNNRHKENSMLCDRCGTCCRKGGPTLQAEDIPLVETVIPLTSLVTLRRGEIVYDNLKQKLTCQSSESVKISGTGEKAFPWHCVFHTDAGLCSIHENRPLQCRALSCKDTNPLEMLYARGQITRSDILVSLDSRPGWSELVSAHEESCAAEKCIQLARILLHAESQAERDDAAGELGALIRSDAAFRELSVQKAGILPEALPFLYGRPMTEILRGTGLAAECADGGKIRFTASGSEVDLS